MRKKCSWAVAAMLLMRPSGSQLTSVHYGMHLPRHARRRMKLTVQGEAVLEGEYGHPEGIDPDGEG